VVSVAPERDSQALHEAAGFQEELGALAFGGAGDDDEAVGGEVGTMHGLDGGYCRFAPLAGAVQDALFGGAEEEVALARVGFEGEGLFGELGWVGNGGLAVWVGAAVWRVLVEGEHWLGIGRGRRHGYRRSVSPRNSKNMK
jgi:hypothetical protein